MEEIAQRIRKAARLALETAAVLQAMTDGQITNPARLLAAGIWGIQGIIDAECSKIDEAMQDDEYWRPAYPMFIKMVAGEYIRKTWGADQMRKLTCQYDSRFAPVMLNDQTIIGKINTDMELVSAAVQDERSKAGLMLRTHIRECLEQAQGLLQQRLLAAEEGTEPKRVSGMRIRKIEKAEEMAVQLIIADAEEVIAKALASRDALIKAARNAVRTLLKPLHTIPYGGRAFPPAGTFKHERD